MYTYAPNGTAEKYPYSIGQLRKDNPQTSFPREPSEELLAEYHVYPVTRTSSGHNPSTQIAESGGCAYVAERGRWETVWLVRDLTAEELASKQAEDLARLKSERAAAYVMEADPLFFKAQRGEATMEEWSAKVEEIRQRYPYPV